MSDDDDDSFDKSEVQYKQKKLTSYENKPYDEALEFSHDSSVPGLSEKVLINYHRMHNSYLIFYCITLETLEVG